MINPSRAVIGGALDMMSIDTLAPISIKAWNRNKSPITNPIRPDKPSHIHILRDASSGKNIPLVKKVTELITRNAITNRVKFTDRDPILRPANSKNIDVVVQHMAVPRAANSPKRDSIIVFLPGL
jgi:hypothetical protein